MPDRGPKPFPILMEVEFLDRLSEPVRDRKAKSVSEIIRTALERYDFTNVVVMHPAQVQISVRLPGEIRRNLKKISRAKHASVGHLVRAAVEAYLPALEALPLAGSKRKKRRKAASRPRSQPAATARKRGGG